VSRFIGDHVYGLLREFGDAEIATLIFPRYIDGGRFRLPKVDGPPITPGKGGAPQDTSPRWKYVALTSNGIGRADWAAAEPASQS